MASWSDGRGYYGEVASSRGELGLHNKHGERYFAGVIAGDSTATALVPQGSDHDVKWEAHFTNLVTYKAEHGDCNVPYCNFGLGNWVGYQRRQYKLFKEEQKSFISQWRIQRLERLGFLWKSPRERQKPGATKKRDPPCQPVDWKTRFQQLCEYRQENGHCLVPQKYPENPGLGRWVHKQRCNYKLSLNGKVSSTWIARVATLESIDFVWVVKEHVLSKDAQFISLAKRSKIKTKKEDDLQLAKATLIQNLQAYRLYIETYARVPQLYKHAIEISVLIGHLEGGTTSVEGVVSGPIRGSVGDTSSFILPIRNNMHVTKKKLIEALRAFRAIAIKSSDPLICAHGFDARVLIQKLEEGAF